MAWHLFPQHSSLSVLAARCAQYQASHDQTCGAASTGTVETVDGAQLQLSTA